MVSKPARTYTCRRYTTDGAVVKQTGLTMAQAKMWAGEVEAHGLEISRGAYRAPHIEDTMGALRRRVPRDVRYYLRIPKPKANAKGEAKGESLGEEQYKYEQVPKTRFVKTMKGEE